MSYVRWRKRGNLLRKEQEVTECEEDFSTSLEMTVSGIEKSKERRMAASGFICFFLPRFKKANPPINPANKDLPY